jgi:hypothetical protein
MPTIAPLSSAIGPPDEPGVGGGVNKRWFNASYVPGYHQEQRSSIIKEETKQRTIPELLFQRSRDILLPHLSPIGDMFHRSTDPILCYYWLLV